MKKITNADFRLLRVAANRCLSASRHVWLAAGIAAGTLSGLTACQFADAPQAIEPVATPPSSPVPTPVRQTAVKKTAVRLPRLEAALKKNIAARLNSWKASIETRNLEKHLQHYADQLETYYLVANASRDIVRSDRARAFEQFDKLKVEVINVDINLETIDSAVITFDKSWDFTKGNAFSNGLVQQEVVMRKTDNQWLIVSEKDIQIYRYRNQ